MFNKIKYDFPSVNNLAWHLRRTTKKLGLWGLMGLAFSLASICFYLFYLIPTDNQLLRLQNELTYVKKNASVNRQQQISSFSPNSSASAVTPRQTSAAEVALFYQQFPAGASLPNWLQAIDTAALKQRLILNRGDYKLIKTKQNQLQRYEIVMPVTGGYIQIRHFIEDVLLHIPVLALSDLQMKRENSLSPTVDAKLVFVLYLQSESWLK